VSARLRRGKLSVEPVVTLGQNFTPESLKFFVRLYYETGQVGKIILETSLSGKVYIR
jgi:hypothetical protein